MPKRTFLDQIRALDPERDYAAIHRLTALHEFPWDTIRALEFALFRTFASPPIGGLLDRTREFGDRPQKRYDDTDLIMCEILEHGFESERGRAALRRLNQLHGRFDIANEDFLYVLSTFVFEPIRWNARFGWRPMIDKEKQAAYHYYHRLGECMNIREIPATYHDFEAFNVAYEREHYRLNAPSVRVADAVRDMLLGWFLPRPLRRFAEPAVYALMDQPLLDAFGFKAPPAWLRRVVAGALGARAWFIRNVMPERRQPFLRTSLPRPSSYPDGYRIEELGPSV